jgi:putative oxidoreductase
MNALMTRSAAARRRPARAAQPHRRPLGAGRPRPARARRRFGIAGVFWLSGRTKVEGFLTVSDNAVALFADEYRVPLLPPELAAHLAAYAEHLFPLLLVLGLHALSALALLGMTAVIQIFVYPDAWPTHLVWATAMLYLVGRGGGALSLDRLLGLR